MKTIVFTLLTLLTLSYTAQSDEDWKLPTKWFEEGVAKQAKAYIENEDMITYYRCATDETPYSIEKPKVKIKPSTTGEPYYDVFVTGKDQTGEKRTRKIFLDDIWVRNEDGKYSNMADDLAIKRECMVEAVNSYFD